MSPIDFYYKSFMKYEEGYVDFDGDVFSVSDFARKINVSSADVMRFAKSNAYGLKLITTQEAKGRIARKWERGRQ